MQLKNRCAKRGMHEPRLWLCLLKYKRKMSYNKKVICPLRVWLEQICHVDYSASEVVIASFYCPVL